MRIDDRLALIGDMQFGLSGPWDCHVWAVRGPEGVVLIDCGVGTHTERILENLKRDFSTNEVAAILLTHAHPDHCGGAAELKRLFGCEVLAPGLTAPVIESGDEETSGLAGAKRSGVYPEWLTIEPCAVDTKIQHGDVLTRGGIRFQAIHVRGHSPDAFGFLAEIAGRRALFSGDIVFYGGVLGVMNAPGSGMDGYRSDLPRLEGLHIDALLPGHGMFTLVNGQQHIDIALRETRKNPLPRQIAQGELIF